MSEEVTKLLRDWGGGDQDALEKLISQVYEELYRIASNKLRSHPHNQSLHATALVNEVYLRLIDASDQRDLELISLDDALRDLEKIDPLQSRIVELRFFGGLSGEETAEVLGISTATISREWKLAKIWLLHQLSFDSLQ